MRKTGCPRVLRRAYAAIDQFTRPLVWSLGMAPPGLIKAVTSACAGLIVVCVFGGAMIESRVLLYAERQVIPLEFVGTDSPDCTNLNLCIERSVNSR